MQADLQSVSLVTSLSTAGRRQNPKAPSPENMADVTIAVTCLLGSMWWRIIMIKNRIIKIPGQVLYRDLMTATRKKRPAMYRDLDNVILHHCNAPSHPSHETKLTIDVMGLQRLSLPPFSPDLAIFPQLKETTMTYSCWRYRWCVTCGAPPVPVSRVWL